MLKYRFDTQIILGKPNNLIWAGAPYEMLGTISASYLSRPEEVMDVIANLAQVSAGTQEDYGWGQDACSFTSEQERTYINYDFDKHTITIPTTEILQLLRDWLAYLQQQPQAA